MPRPLGERQSEFFGSGLESPRSRFPAGVTQPLTLSVSQESTVSDRNRCKSRFVRPSGKGSVLTTNSDEIFAKRGFNDHSCRRFIGCAFCSRGLQISTVKDRCTRKEQRGIFFRFQFNQLSHEKKFRRCSGILRCLGTRRELDCRSRKIPVDFYIYKSIAHIRKIQPKKLRFLSSYYQ